MMRTMSENKRGRFFFILLALFFALYLFASGKDSLFSSFKLHVEESGIKEDLSQIQNSLMDFSLLEEQLTQAILGPGDIDQDGLDNRVELLLGSDISDVDSDKDGVNDYEEFLQKTDLTDSQNTTDLSPQFIEKRVQQLTQQGIGEAESWAEVYYLELARNEDLTFAEHQGAFYVNLAYQYHQTESFFKEQLAAAYESGQNTFALLLAKSYVQIYPDNPDVFFHLGYAHQTLEQFTEAEDQYQLALSAGSQLPALYNNLGVLAQNRGEIDLAKSYYQQAIDLDPENDGYKENKALLQNQE